MAEHTPTPWNFDELTPNARGEQDGCGYIRCETDNLEISHHGDRGRSRDENVANATFIVKACNSHDALVKALQLHTVWEALPTDRGGINGTKGRAWVAFIKARDAALQEAAR